ncbi:hypothetical protein [Kitasatospora sp. NPDC048407]|uniref:hypothetical protein n=1 Tax=Kitasatospora sp. NPDC048407 TaxID=3364051 RepID=UPI0037240101
MISARVVAGCAAADRRFVSGSQNRPATSPCGEPAVCGLLSPGGAAAAVDATAAPPSTLPTAASRTAARRAPPVPRPGRAAGGAVAAGTGLVRLDLAELDQHGRDLPLLGEWDSPFTEAAAGTT